MTPDEPRSEPGDWKTDFRAYVAEGREIAPAIDGGWFCQRMQAALDEVAAFEDVLTAAREMNRLLWAPHEPRDLMIKRRALNVALELYDRAVAEHAAPAQRQGAER